MISPEFRELAEAILDELETTFPLGYRPQILWKGLRVAAGYAYYRQQAIGLSTRLITDEERLRTTLLHEYAHLLAVARYGAKGAGHGMPWKEAMRDLGLEPSTRHQYEVERNQKRQEVIYRCKRCSAEFSRRRKFPRNRRYLHIDCGGLIVFVRVQVLVEDQQDVA